MKVVIIRTDKPLAEAGFYQDNKQMAYKKWQAHRQLSITIHQRIEELLRDNGLGWADIGGVIFYAGPGSFTGLRIGASITGSLAAGLGIPIVSTRGEDWIDSGLRKLQAGEDEKIPVPFYGQKPRVTKQKK